MDLKLKIDGTMGMLNMSSDASWNTAKVCKAFASYVVNLGDSLIGWKSRKQRIVDLSTVEAELNAIEDAICHQNGLYHCWKI